MPTRSSTIPEKAFDGSWWSVPALARVDCPRCGEASHGQPAVMRYIEEQNFFHEHKHFRPLWPERGWLVEWTCGHCGWF
jgi:hypothetical protein